MLSILFSSFHMYQIITLMGVEPSIGAREAQLESAVIEREGRKWEGVWRGRGENAKREEVGHDQNTLYICLKFSKNTFLILLHVSV